MPVGKQQEIFKHKVSQTQKWLGAMGKEVTDGGIYSPPEINKLYLELYGVTRLEINEEFLESVPYNSKILEVGCGTATQLRLLQEQGFSELYGLELQPYALKKARELCHDITFTEGNCHSLPFADSFFDLTFTNGVLMHIPPKYLSVAISELIRCSRHWIWGFEYWSKEEYDVNWHG